MNELLAKVKSKQVDSLVAIKRIRISENPEKNHNPVLQGVRIDHAFWAPGPRPAKVLPGERLPLEAVAPDSSSESYNDLDVDGNPVQKTENLIVSWFTSFGAVKEARSAD